MSRIFCLILSLTIISEVAANEGRTKRQAACMELMDIFGIPQREDEVKPLLAELNRKYAKDALKGEMPATDLELNRLAEAVCKGVEPDFIEVFVFSQVSFRPPKGAPSPAYVSTVMPVIGNPLVIPQLAKRLIERAENLTASDPDSAERHAKAGLILIVSERMALGAGAFAPTATSDAVMAAIRIPDEHKDRYRNVVSQFKVDQKAVLELYGEYYSRLDALIDTPANTPLDAVVVNECVERFEKFWNLNEMYIDIRAVELSRLVQLLLLAKSQQDQAALARITKCIEEIKAATPSEIEKRWLATFMDETGERPKKRFWNQKPPLQELKPKAPG